VALAVGDGHGHTRDLAQQLLRVHRPSEAQVAAADDTHRSGGFHDERALARPGHGNGLGGL
jgi:hypothetical protein